MDRSEFEILLGTYEGEKVEIDLSEVRYGVISGISATRKEILINKIKRQLKGVKIFSINIENEPIEKLV
ncbi:hypothetical protein [Paramaledivibacter caminithermalis]|jgi:hypothetical protein|uniref:Uncharacterized protein n=1 Tax=Paramaledivibacter caminithermalis (strain DSM 15212 / CIP 107654 / DViRD3) TaxID=1121301 RepID=A0A1M6TW95_PARC5|nr:hypothetical protein [Paramaledivibacter caminithermalis]SHK61211.1 hypothetical protein SAMN02745912_03812 [Paramaledivibacter caminithermalis DSM 15212]